MQLCKLVSLFVWGSNLVIYNLLVREQHFICIKSHTHTLEAAMPLFLSLYI